MNAPDDIAAARLRVDTAAFHERQSAQDFRSATGIDADVTDPDAFDYIAAAARDRAGALRRLRFARLDLARIERSVIGGE